MRLGRFWGGPEVLEPSPDLLSAKASEKLARGRVLAHLGRAGPTIRLRSKRRKLRFSLGLAIV